MDETKLSKRLQDPTDLTPEEWAEAVHGWGYRLLDRPHAHSPGYRILLVALRDTPTHEHYDPEWVELCLLKPENLLESIRLSRATQTMTHGRVCPGDILLEDRVRKEVHFFTYGARLDVVHLEELTVCAFLSTAPILPLFEEWSTFANQLESESAAQLAEIRARWGIDETGYVQRLAKTPENEIYIAALRSIITTYRRSPVLKESFQEFYISIREELRWQLENNGVPEQGPLLEELLGPSS